MQDTPTQFVCELISMITKISEIWILCAAIFVFTISPYWIAITYFFFLIFYFSGIGHDDSEYIDISPFNFSSMAYQLLQAFKQSGFANQSLGKYKLLPCSLGWFVNASSEANECVECPAGKLLLSLTDNTSLNRGDCLWYGHFALIV